MPEEIKNQMIYLVALDILRRLANKGIDVEILTKINNRNAETMNCGVIELF